MPKMKIDDVKEGLKNETKINTNQRPEKIRRAMGKIQTAHAIKGKGDG
jgi:hypothetical protein